MAKVTKDMLIGQLITLDPNIAPILMRAGMHCLGCPSSLPWRIISNHFLMKKTGEDASLFVVLHIEEAPVARPLIFWCIASIRAV